MPDGRISGGVHSHAWEEEERWQNALVVEVLELEVVLGEPSQAMTKWNHQILGECEHWGHTIMVHKGK